VIGLSRREVDTAVGLRRDRLRLHLQQPAEGNSDDGEKGSTLRVPRLDAFERSVP
jgi:hypothetical protein